MEIEQSALVAIVLFVAAQVILSIRQGARQAALIESLKEFAGDTKRRFETQDQIIAKHQDQLSEHGAKLGHLFGHLGVRDHS